MFRYMKVPKDAKNKKEEILKAFGCVYFSERCIKALDGVGYLDTTYFFQDEPLSPFLWGCSDDMFTELLEEYYGDVIELFLSNKLKYLNKGTKDV